MFDDRRRIVLHAVPPFAGSIDVQVDARPHAIVDEVSRLCIDAVNRQWPHRCHKIAGELVHHLETITRRRPQGPGSVRDQPTPQSRRRTGRVALSRRSFDRTAIASARVVYLRYVEPPHTYVHEASSSVVHHADYLNRDTDQPLCGAAFEKPAQLDSTIRPVAVCPDCEAKLAEYHLIWWRERAEAPTAELDGLRAKYRELAEYVDNQRRHAGGLQQPAPVMGDPSGETPESRREIDGEPQAGSTSEHGETTPM